MSSRLGSMQLSTPKTMPRLHGCGMPSKRKAGCCEEPCKLLQESSCTVLQMCIVCPSACTYAWSQNKFCHSDASLGVLSANAEFYRCFREGDIKAMDRVWDDGNDGMLIACMHPAMPRVTDPALHILHSSSQPPP
jgi:hypothetical protein